MIGYFDTELGRVQISPSIVRRFIMNEVRKNRFFRFPGIKPKEPMSRKMAERAIRVTFVEGNVEVVLMLSVLYGTRIIKEARALQGTITRALQLGTGLTVNKISINVESVFEEEEEEPLLLDHDSVSANAVNQ